MRGIKAETKRLPAWIIVFNSRKNQIFTQTLTHPPKNKADEANSSALSYYMAERMGFEPMVEVSPHTRLAGDLSVS